MKKSSFGNGFSVREWFLKCFKFWSGASQTPWRCTQNGASSPKTQGCGRRCFSPPFFSFPLPHFFPPHSSCHSNSVLIPSLHAEPFEKVWHLWSTFPHRPCNFWLYFYVFQIQVSLKVPASQVTLTLRTSQKTVSLVGDSSCCFPSPAVARSQPSTRVVGCALWAAHS